MTVIAADKPKLAVLDVQAVGVPGDQAVAIGEAMTQELSRRGFFEVISSSDIRTLLGVERQKQLMGCGDSNCTAELSGALGARFVLQATLTRLGDSLQLSLQMLDSDKAQSVARSVRLAKDTRQLAQLLPWALAEATATPLPPAPSKALPWTLIGVGAATFAIGGILAVDGFSRQRAVVNELRANNGVYQSYAHYQEEFDVILRNERVGVSLAVGGAALIGLGVFLFPKDTGGGAIALVPSSNGAFVVGSFP
jgi:TolB-like protein